MGSDLSQMLLERLVAQAFEGMSREEKLAFVEKLFQALSPAAQQEFLLALAREIMAQEQAAGGKEGARRHRRSPPFWRYMLEQGPGDFGPWQMCCRVMNEFVQAPQAESAATAMVARVFNALADETRLKIIKLLAEGEKSVEELVQILGIAQSTTSHHLRVLRETGLIRGEKRGRHIYYSLTHPLREGAET